MDTSKRASAIVAKLAMTATLICLAFVWSCGGDAAADFVHGKTHAEVGEEIVLSTPSGIKVVNCNDSVDCQPYEACVEGGYVTCRSSHCTVLNNDAVDLQCVVDVYEEYGLDGPPAARAEGAESGTSSSGTDTSNHDPSGSSSASGGSAPGPEFEGPVLCEYVSAPAANVLQTRDHSFCSFWHGVESGDDQFRPAFEAVAETPGSTVTISDFTLYGIRTDGQWEAIAGTGAGDSTPIYWLGLYELNPWYKKQYESLDPGDGRSFTITQTDRVWHGGTNNWDDVGSVEIEGFVDGVIVARLKTTGDAKVRLVLDYYNGDQFRHEGTLGDWVSCSSGGGIWTSTPRRDAPQDCRTTVAPPAHLSADDSVGGGSSSSVGGCPATGIQVTAGPSLQAACPRGGVEVVTWDDAGHELASARGERLTVGAVWTGFAAVALRCDAKSYFAVEGSNAQQGGFARVCSRGVNVTSETAVCDDGNGPKITVALNPAEAGRCN